MKARAKKDNSQLNVNLFYNILKFEISQKINVSFTEVYQVNFSQTQTCLKKKFSFFLCAYHHRFFYLTLLRNYIRDKCIVTMHKSHLNSLIINGFQTTSAMYMYLLPTECNSLTTLCRPYEAYTN